MVALVIREATIDDYNIIEALSVNFNTRYYGIPLNTEKLRRWTKHVLDNGVIYLSKSGLIAGFIADDPIRDHTVLVENAWYSEDRTGVQLLRRFIQYGRDNGCDEVRMTTLNNTPARATALLSRMGFEEIEISHRLTL